MITESRLEKALTFIAQTDDDHATLKANMLRAEHAAKKTKAMMFLIAPVELTIAQREASAVASPEYHSAMSDYFSSVEEFNAMNNKRDLEFVVIECFRTLEASRRQGNI